MGFFDTLFGRQKPVPVGPERLFAMSTAQLTLETEQDLTPTGKAAICFKGVDSGPFKDIQQELSQLLELAGRDDQLTITPYEDAFNYRWFIFSSKDFQALVTTLHVASETLISEGYGSMLMFAIFAFKDDKGHEVYWMYNYKRGFFYPFVPETDINDSQRRRNNAEEMRLSAAIGKELPLEPELERWFPVWEVPV